MAEIIANGIAMPSPVSISTDNEIIWSSDTGRALDGTMIGDVIAEKRTLKIDWGVLKEEELKLISDNMISGFFPIQFHDDGMDIVMESYRGTLSKEHIGKLDDGIYYYRSASVEIVQR